MKTPFCFVRIIPTLTAWDRVSPIFPAGQGVNGLLYPRSLLGCVWLSPSCVCWMLALSSMRCPRWLLCPVYGIARKCDRIATTLESKQKQSITIKQENDVSSTLYALIKSTRLHRFHALGAGGREFESRHSDLKMHVSSLIIGVLFCFIGEIDERFLKVCKKCATTPQRFIDSP